MGCISCGEGFGPPRFQKGFAARRFGHSYSSWRMISSSLGLCLVSRPVRGSVSMTRAGLGWPTRSRALAFTALVAENIPGLRFVMARMSMK